MRAAGDGTAVSRSWPWAPCRCFGHLALASTAGAAWSTFARRIGHVPCSRGYPDVPIAHRSGRGSVGAILSETQRNCCHEDASRAQDAIRRRSGRCLRPTSARDRPRRGVSFVRGQRQGKWRLGPVRRRTRLMHLRRVDRPGRRTAATPGEAGQRLVGRARIVSRRRVRITIHVDVLPVPRTRRGTWRGPSGAGWPPPPSAAARRAGYCDCGPRAGPTRPGARRQGPRTPRWLRAPNRDQKRRAKGASRAMARPEPDGAHPNGSCQTIAAIITV